MLRCVVMSICLMEDNFVVDTTLYTVYTARCAINIQCPLKWKGSNVVDGISLILCV